MTSSRYPQLQLLVMLLIFDSSYFNDLVNGRIHNINLNREDRDEITLSSFGFLKDGYLAVHVSNLALRSYTEGDPKSAGEIVGFTLCRRTGNGLPTCWDNQETEPKCSCPITALTETRKGTNMVAFRIDMKAKKIRYETVGSALQDLFICDMTYEEFSQVSACRAYPDFVSTSAVQHKRLKRAADVEADDEPDDDDSPKSTSSSTSSATTSSLPPSSSSPSSTSSSTQQSTTSTRIAMTTVRPRDHEKSCIKSLKNGTNSFDISVEKSSDKRYISSFVLLIKIGSKSEQGLYDLHFHNCHNGCQPGNPILVNFTLEVIERNCKSFLSAGEIPLTQMYFGLCFVCFIFSCIWLWYLRKHRDEVYKLHFLMLALIYLKCISYLFHAIHFHFIGKTGAHKETWSILYYIVHLIKGALLFIAIVLIGSGWAFIKHFLSAKEKKIFLVVIPLQVLANIAQIITEESDKSASEYLWWNEVFILIDILCCGAILLPIIWSIRHLQDASQTDGKAAINLQKLKLFRHFYITIVVYIYFTRIIVYLLKITVPFEYDFLYELFKELATMIFFMVTGYKFRPVSNNPYLRVALSDNEEDEEEDEILTRSGTLETVVNIRSGRKQAGGEGESMRMLPTSREQQAIDENSHDYD